MRVIGTAGHVDHGKSTLVKRLTGTDPDRLAEERARALTIDLGFAWLTLPDGETLGIIDVPGHRDFIENMLAGVGGIDAALLVVAADEGVMPQTREHLAILDLLGIDAGIVALTRVDLVDDAEWLELVRDEVQELLAGTGLASAPLLPVSATADIGIESLLDQLSALLARRSARANAGQPRLPVDRVFTMSGFGTVLTGTLGGGALKSGDEVELQPGALKGRIRGLQSYGRKVGAAQPGARVAVNVSGLATADVARGHVLGRPGRLRTTRLVDLRFRHLPAAARPLRHDAEVKFFCGTAEAVARVRLLEGDELQPGESGWLQLRLADALQLAQGDRFILRRPSPAETIGGGLVLDPHPAQYWKRNRAEVLQRLRILADGSPSERLALAASGGGPRSRDDLQGASGLVGDDFAAALDEALRQGLLVSLPGSRWLAAEDWQNLTQGLRDALAAFHAKYPLRQGMPREALRSRLGVQQTLLATLVEKDPQVSAEADLLRLAAHSVSFTAEQQTRVDRLLDTLGARPYGPPSWSQALDLTGEDLLVALADSGKIIRVTPEVFFSRRAWRELARAALDRIEQDGSVSAGQLRDRFNTSRKYVIALLEALDEMRVTRREGDVRVRGPAPLPELLREDRPGSQQ